MSSWRTTESTSATVQVGDPEIIQRLNDLAWLPFLGIVSTAIVQGVVIGVAILKDPSEDPLIPRWAGYFNIWIVSMFVPAGLIPFFKDGPLAWNGILTWWLALVAFFLWLVVFSIVLIRAIKREAREQADTRPPDVADLARRVAALESERALA